MTCRRYIVIESAISMAINAAISVAFALIVFGRAATVDLDARGTWLDTVPQSFMVALMATLVPSLIARRRIAAGQLGFGAGRQVRLAIAAPLAGLAAAVVGTALYPLLVPAATVALPDFVTGKALYGAILGGTVTATALHTALGEEARA